MLVGYMRISKIDGSQLFDLQKNSLLQYGVLENCIYADKASGRLENREGLAAALKALRKNDTLVVWKLDRLGRSLSHLIKIVDDLHKNNIGLKVLTGYGSEIDTSTSNGKMFFGIFASLAEYERALISERTKAGLVAARARGKRGGRNFIMTESKLSIIQAAMSKKDTNVSQLCREMGISRYTIYRYVSPSGALREFANKLIAQKNK